MNGTFNCASIFDWKNYWADSGGREDEEEASLSPVSNKELGFIDVTSLATEEEDEEGRMRREAGDQREFPLIFSPCPLLLSLK